MPLVYITWSATQGKTDTFWSSLGSFCNSLIFQGSFGWRLPPDPHTSPPVNDLYSKWLVTITKQYIAHITYTHNVYNNSILLWSFCIILLLWRYKVVSHMFSIPTNLLYADPYMNLFAFCFFFYIRQQVCICSSLSTFLLFINF